MRNPYCDGTPPRLWDGEAVRRDNKALIRQAEFVEDYLSGAFERRRRAAQKAIENSHAIYDPIQRTCHICGIEWFRRGEKPCVTVNP